MNPFICIGLLIMSVNCFQISPSVISNKQIIFPTYSFNVNYPLIKYSNSAKFPKISYKNIHSTNLNINNRVNKRYNKSVQKKKARIPKMFVFINEIEKYTINCFYNYVFSIKSLHCFPLSFVFKFKNFTKFL